MDDQSKSNVLGQPAQNVQPGSPPVSPHQQQNVPPSEHVDPQPVFPQPQMSPVPQIEPLSTQVPAQPQPELSQDQTSVSEVNPQQQTPEPSFQIPPPQPIVPTAQPVTLPETLMTPIEEPVVPSMPQANQAEMTQTAVVPEASRSVPPISQPEMPQTQPVQLQSPTEPQVQGTRFEGYFQTPQSPASQVIDTSNAASSEYQPVESQNVPNLATSPISQTPPAVAQQATFVEPVQSPSKEPLQQPPGTPILEPRAPISPPGAPVRNKFAFGKLPAKPIIIGIVLILIVLLAIFFRTRFLNQIPNFGTKGEIVWWGFSEEERTVAPLIKEFEAGNPGITVKYVKQSPQDFRERLQNSLASGKGPDIFEIHNSWVPMFMNDFDALPSSVMSESEFTQAFYPVIVSDLKTSKGIVGIPLQYDAITLYINHDVFTSAAQVPPKTWDEFRQLLPSLVPTGGDIVQSAVAMGTTVNVDHWPEILALLMLQNKVDLAKPEGRLVVDALNFYQSFSQSSGWKETFPPSTIAFARGQTAMYFGPSWRATEIITENPALRFKTVNLPQIANERPEDPKVSYATYWFEAVWRRSSERENAWKLLSFLSKPESLEKMQTNRVLPKPYPRMEMKLSQIEDPLVGSIIDLAPFARSWYFADTTHDGPNGINTQLNLIYKKYLDQKLSQDAAVGLSLEVQQLLSKYGVVVR